VATGAWRNAPGRPAPAWDANSAANRSYVAEYVIAAGEANTDVVKRVTIPGDTSGTWLSDTGVGLNIRWGLSVGSTFQQAAGSWGAANAIGSSNQFNFMGTTGNVFELFDVGLYEGAAAPVFQVPDYVSEFVSCRRYFRMSAAEGAGTPSTTTVFFFVKHEGMRVAPTVAAAAALVVTDINAANFTQSTAQASISSNSSEGGLYSLGNFTGLTVGKLYIFQNAGATNVIKLNSRLL
jgi:hypothetical protein